jgi:hypothetical protein
MKLKRLLEWVETDKVFCRSFPTEERADAAMDRRDKPATEQAWQRAHAAVKERLTAFESSPDLQVIEAIARAAFRRSFGATLQHDDLAAQVSDDMRLLAEAELTGYRSKMLEALQAAYVRGVFLTDLA